jgi:hypothetical protein
LKHLVGGGVLFSATGLFTGAARNHAGFNSGIVEIGFPKIGRRSFRTGRQDLKDIQATHAAEGMRSSFKLQAGIGASNRKTAETALRTVVHFLLKRKGGSHLQAPVQSRFSFGPSRTSVVRFWEEHQAVLKTGRR